MEQTVFRKHVKQKIHEIGNKLKFTLAQKRLLIKQLNNINDHAVNILFDILGLTFNSKRSIKLIGTDEYILNLEQYSSDIYDICHEGFLKFSKYKLYSRISGIEKDDFILVMNMFFEGCSNSEIKEIIELINTIFKEHTNNGYPIFYELEGE